MKTLSVIAIGAMSMLAVSLQTSEPAQAIDAQPSPLVAEHQDIKLSPVFAPQFQQHLLGGWEEEESYITKGKTYSDEQIKKAIKQGVDFILSEQREDGSWDVTLLEGFLGETADDAVDTTIATSLSGLALRAHAGVDQERISKALEKARVYLADRVTRGKLPTKVQYACWRYAFGLKFLANEYKYLPEGDEEGRERLETVMTRMRDAVIKMQLIPKEKSFSDGDPMPASLGIMVSPPTMTDYLGGAPIESIREGSRAATSKAGPLGTLRPGDRIFKFGRKRVENAFDYYSAEAETIEGKSYTLYVKRDGKIGKLQILAEKTWPADLGVVVRDWSDDKGRTHGVEITNFRRGSVLQAEGAEVGDVILSVDSKKTENRDEFLAEEADLPIWRRNKKIRVLRGRKKTTYKITVRPRPIANLGFYPNDEDKNSENGVGVLAFPRDRRTGRPVATPASKAGLMVDDFITEINGQKILGYDHYVDVLNKTPGYSDVVLKVLRDGESHEIKYESGAIPFPGWFGFKLNDDFEEANPDQLGMIGEVEKGTPASKAGIRSGDVITKFEINGQIIDIENHPYNQRWQRYSQFVLAEHFSGLFSAGDSVKVTLKRKRKEFSKTMIVAIAPGDAVTAEGGWAYYAKGYAPSFVTGAMLIFFEEVEEIVGKEMRLPRNSHKAAVKAVAGMRKKDERSRQWGYVYDQRPMEKDLAGLNEEQKKNAIAGWQDLRGHMGRIMVCELALGINKKRSKSAIRKSLKNWLERRNELDIVRNYPLTHYRKRFQNAAYYWLFGHYFSLRAANFLGERDKTAKEARETILSVVMQDQESNGTWLGHHAFGPLCGTGLALMILGEFDHSWRMPSGAAKPITPGGGKRE